MVQVKLTKKRLTSLIEEARSWDIDFSDSKKVIGYCIEKMSNIHSNSLVKGFEHSNSEENVIKSYFLLAVINKVAILPHQDKKFFSRIYNRFNLIDEKNPVETFLEEVGYRIES